MNFTIVNKSVIICGKRGSGKSILCRYLVTQEASEFDEIFVISGTEDANHFYESFIDKRNIFTEFKADWLQSFFSKIENQAKNDKKQSVLLILDDVASDQDFKKDNTLQRIFIKSRHYGLSIIVLQQFLYQIAPICRANSDWVFCGQMNQKSSIILADEYILGDITKRDFYKLYHKLSSNHSFMVINNTTVEDISDLNQLYGKVKVPIEYTK
jgi:hypothetical protein